MNKFLKEDDEMDLDSGSDAPEGYERREPELNYLPVHACKKGQLKRTASF